jgi:hypothetical protein
MNFSEFYDTLDPKSDKGIEHNYINGWYNDEFTPKQNESLTILEIGINKGYSINLFRKWFINSRIIGIDNGDEITDEYRTFINNIENVELIWGDAYSDTIINKFENESIDYLIDDGPHTTQSQLDCIEKWYPKIKKGGTLIIEDIQSFDTTKSTFVEYSNKLRIDMEIIDLRHTKFRRDDVLLIFKK